MVLSIDEAAFLDWYRQLGKFRKIAVLAALLLGWKPLLRILAPQVVESSRKLPTSIELDDKPLDGR